MGTMPLASRTLKPVTQGAYLLFISGRFVSPANQERMFKEETKEEETETLTEQFIWGVSHL